jgi:hypothetical protein
MTRDELEAAREPFTFYWRDGRRDVYRGIDAADALNNAGYGAGALRALDFHAKGDDSNWRWVPETREWVSTKRAE